MATIAQQQSIRPYQNFLTGMAAAGLFFFYIAVVIEVVPGTSNFRELILLGIVQVAPAVLIFTRRKYNFMAFVMINHFVQYTFAKYNLVTNIERGSRMSPATINASQELLLCSIFMITAYYTLKLLLTRDAVYHQKPIWLRLSPREYVWCGILASSFPFAQSLLPITMVTMGSVFCAIALLILYTSEPPTPTLGRLMKTCIYVSVTYYFLSFGSLNLVGSLATIVFLMTFTTFRFRNFLVLAILVVAASAIQSIKYEYRLISRTADLNVFEQLGVLYELIATKYVDTDEDIGIHNPDADFDGVEDDKETTSDSLARGFSRVGDDSIERVLEWTPSKVPFWEGETYEHLPYIFIPRIIWPDKPVRDFWNKFGKTYGFISTDDHATSVGVGYLAEGYMNFGYAGMYSIAIIMGVFILLMEMLSTRILGRPTYFCTLAFLVPIASFGADFSTIVSSVVITVATLLLLRYRLIRMMKSDVYE